MIFIPRPRKRPKTPNIDAIYGALTVNEIRKRYGLEPVRGAEPIYIGGKQYGEVKEHTPEPPRSPLNCPNCCAPVVKSYCEYCGTRFGFTVVKVDGFKKRDEIEQIKKSWNEKELLYADNKIVAEFTRFHEVAHDLGDSPKLPIQKER